MSLVPSDIQAQINRWRSNGETIVFTNGCFDIIHAGHVDYLTKARSFGDRLIVGLNSDASVSRLKGPNRPVVGQTHRKMVLDGLKAVDAVIIFNEDTPIELLSELKPNVHVKGGDYTAENLPEYNTVVSNGGRVEIVGFLPGCSTSTIIEKILK